MITRRNPDSLRSNALVPVLQEHPYFTNIPETSLYRLIQRARRHAFGAGQILFLAGERSAGLWIVESGRIEVYKMSPEGREHVLHLLGPGDTFNDVPAFDGGPTAASAMSITGPDTCIDCGACVPKCPYEAIFCEEERPFEYEMQPAQWIHNAKELLPDGQPFEGEIDGNPVKLSNAKQLEGGEILDLTEDIIPNYNFFTIGLGYSALDYEEGD